MADQEDFPLLQGQPPAQAAPPPQQDTAGLAQRWNNWIGSPQNRAALIQFGIALSQPIPAGQNIGGQIGSAFGQAGEASDRVTAQEQRQQELESKQDLRSAQATAQEARAGTAGARLETQAARLQLMQQGLEQRNQTERLKAMVRLHGMHGTYLNKVRELNAKRAVFNQPLLPEMSQQEWLDVNPDLKQILSPSGGMGGGGGGSGAAPVQVNSPEDLKNYPSGTRYVTPDGRTGTVP